jgi:hypothetical protein
MLTERVGAPAGRAVPQMQAANDAAVLGFDRKQIFAGPQRTRPLRNEFC